MSKFSTHYEKKHLPGESFPSPSVTVPDQSMTIQEIIARYTRTGALPVSSAPLDSGGNEAFDPGFDPLDYQPDDIVQSLAPKKPSNESSPASPTSTPSEGVESPKEPENGS